METTESENRGFTLMEIFIVVIVLCITASVVVPQFSRASQQARLSELLSDLQDVRSQIELYRIQHEDRLPGQAEKGGAVDPARFVQDLTQQGADGLGPYLKRIPRNTFNGLDTIAFVSEAEVRPDDRMNTGWWFNAATGEFRANDCAMNSQY
jgi:general secretion pathway protein G